MKKATLALLLAFLAVSAFAQNKQPNPWDKYATQKRGIHVECSCEDIVGKELFTSVLDLIAGNPRYYESNADEVKGAAAEVQPMTLHISTLDPLLNQKSVVYSVIFTYPSGRGKLSFYMDSVIGTCNEDAVKSCASRIVATLDDFN